MGIRGEERHCKGGFSKVSLCLTEPMSASSKTGMPRAKAEPIRDGDSASLTTYLRRGKHYCAKAIVARDERSENMSEGQL